MEAPLHSHICRSDAHLLFLGFFLSLCGHINVVLVFCCFQVSRISILVFLSINVTFPGFSKLKVVDMFNRNGIDYGDAIFRGILLCCVGGTLTVQNAISSRLLCCVAHAGL